MFNKSKNKQNYSTKDTHHSSRHWSVSSYSCRLSALQTQAEALPGTEGSNPCWLNKREKNRLKGLRRKQRRRERWLLGQLELQKEGQRRFLLEVRKCFFTAPVEKALQLLHKSVYCRQSSSVCSQSKSA